MRFGEPSAVTRSWTHPDPASMRRAGHAVLAGGGVWVIDPPDGPGVDDAVRELGEPRGVLQLLDRHPRDCAPVAERLGVPLHKVPVGTVAPFETVALWHLPFWKEDALWLPEERVLVVAEAIVANPAWTAHGEAAGVHPMRRLLPPTELNRFADEVEHLLLGHGNPFHGDAARAALREALHHPRRKLATLPLNLLRR